MREAAAGQRLAIALGRRLQVALDLGACSSAAMRAALSNAVSSAKAMLGTWRSSTVRATRRLQKRRAALQPGHDLVGIGAGERHHKGGSVPQIGADPHLGHRDVGVAQRRIAQFARPQQLRQRMAQLLADPQLPLARHAGARADDHDRVAWA